MSRNRQLYAGWKQREGAVDVIEHPDISSQQFWSQYISQRKPVVIQGHPTDEGWKASAKWDNDYLIQHAGNCDVLVEQRSGPKDSYGKGNKTKMKFKDFITRMAGGDDNLYLSSQSVPVGSDGHPALYAAPLTSLDQDFVVVPELMGNLVPQQCNVWMGATKDGSSSGLHHDFHDNLYVLLRGRKRFRLYDPSMAPQMYTHGRIALIHPNGRIVYEGQGDVCGDGSESTDVAQWHAQRCAETLVARAEGAVARGEEGAAQLLAEAEERLEKVLEKTLDDARDDFDDVDMDEDGEGGGGTGTAQAREPDPPSFSRVNLAASDAETKRLFPNFPGRAAALEVTLEAGQMLYLPAGWFHEVTSFGGSSSGGHMAFNFWFHPPNNLERRVSDFARPYLTDYWPSLWAARQQEMGLGVPEATDAGAGGEGMFEGEGVGDLTVDREKVRQMVMDALARYQHKKRKPKPPIGRRHHLVVYIKHC